VAIVFPPLEGLVLYETFPSVEKLAITAAAPYVNQLIQERATGMSSTVEEGLGAATIGAIAALAMNTDILANTGAAIGNAMNLVQFGIKAVSAQFQDEAAMDEL
jgi:hypothetical protein